MATLAQKKRSGKSGGHDNKTAHRQAEEKKDSAAQRKVMRSAYLQTKMAVSTPGDTQEQEADRVADEVSRMPKGVARAADETAPPGSSQPENNAEQPQSLQTKISRMGEEPETARTKLCRDNLEEANPKLMRSEEEDTTAQAKLHRQEEEPTNTETDAEAASPETPVVADETEQKIESLRGQGNPMADDIRQEMEGKLHADFSRVSIHTSGDSDALCKQLSARAFTVGNDIFFAAGEYAPTTEAGRKLLAHELTHVVQQSSEINRLIQRDETTAPPPETSGTPTDGLVNRTNKTVDFESIQIPAFKGIDHRARLYDSWTLKRSKSYSGSRPSDQQAVWKRSIQTQEIERILLEKANAAHFTPVGGQYLFSAPARPITRGVGRAHVARGQRHFYIGSLRDIAKESSAPSWNRRGSTTTSMEVDHIVEMQISGFPDIDRETVHGIGNMELLERRPNSESGNIIDNDIDQKVSALLINSQKRELLEYSIPGLQNTTNQNRKQSLIRNNYDFNFSGYDARGGSRVGDASFWSREQVEAGEHLAPIEPASFSELGQEGRALVFPTSTGGIGKQFIWDGQNTAPVSADERNWFKPFTMTAKRFYTSEPQQSLWFGEFDLQIDENNEKFKPCRKTVYVDKIAGSSLAGTISQMQVRRSVERLEVKAASPIEMSYVGLEDGRGFVMEGEVLPTIPFLENANLNFRFEDGDIYVFRTFSASDLSIPSPFSIENSSLTVSINTANGLQIDGAVDFGIENVGKGSISGTANAGGEFAVEGQFNFDERLFGEGTTAQVRMGYANEQWSMGGTITIPEGKVPGVTSATIDVNYSEGDGFSARGDATLDIPGVESGTIEITQSEEAGFSIGGTFNLSPDAPGIRGGSISVTLSERPDGTGYALSATGEAQPDIPGINSNLIVSYNDGAFTAEIEADYSRGMLSGRVNAGVTNRSVSEDGQTLSETAEPDNPLIVYGGGSLSLQLAPWLQATAGVQFSPNGEITVTGEIGLPDELEIFARREINKSIFNIAVQAPIFPGIVAEIGGGLSATAGIGPGVIDQLRLGVTYNPDHEEDTHITGDAHLNIPANAGLRLSVRAGIGLGITGASATGGLDIGGTLGIEGAAEAGVHVDWTPATGLDIEAEVAVHAQPSFTFDIGGYVSVRALGFSVYDERWEFASYTFGSDYRFGIRLPIHYREGEPFDISLDDVEFEVPDIDTNQLLRGLVARIA